MAYYLKQMYFVFSCLKPTSAAKWAQKTEAETMKRSVKSTRQWYYYQAGAVLPLTHPRPQTRSRGSTTARRQRYYHQVPGSGSTAGGTGTGTGEAPKPSVYPLGTRPVPSSFYHWQGIRTRLDTVLPLLFQERYYRWATGTTAACM